MNDTPAADDATTARDRPELSLRQVFLDYALECRGYSPLYDCLSLAVAEDADLQRIAGRNQPGQPPPNLIFAAAHYLLLRGEQHELRRYFASVRDGPPQPPKDAAAAFRDFCLRHEEEMSGLVATRLVQTN